MAKKVRVLGKQRTVKSSVRNRRLAAEYAAKLDELDHMDDALNEFEEDDVVPLLEFLSKKLEASTDFIESIFKLSEEEIEKLEDMEDDDTMELSMKIVDTIYFADK